MDQVKDIIMGLNNDDIAKLYNGKSNDNRFTYIAKGGQGVVYKVLNYAIKITRANSVSHNEKNIIDIMSKNNDSYQNTNFIKIYLMQRIGDYIVSIMELADGTLVEWTKAQHTDCEWISMILQIVIGVYIMQSEYNMFHADMKPKNILFKQFDSIQNIKYTIGGKVIDIATRYLFLISDFGHAVTTTFTGKYTASDVQSFIKSNADLYELASIHKRLIVDDVILKYSIRDLIGMGKDDDHFLTYYKKTTNDTNTKMKNFPQSIKNKMIVRSLAYYLVEKNMINLQSFTNLPSKNIVTHLESLLYDDIHALIKRTYEGLTELC